MSVSLIGDSVFDNGPYLRHGEPNAAAVIQERLQCDVQCVAVDGAMLRHMLHQVAWHDTIIISGGGNDALAFVHRFDPFFLYKFWRDVGRVLDAFSGPGKRVAMCQIYRPRWRWLGCLVHIPNLIIRIQAGRRNIATIDNYSLFNEDSDFANDIEPSVKGSRKLAVAIETFIQRSV